jgi:hypothetical protein
VVPNFTFYWGIKPHSSDGATLIGYAGQVARHSTLLQSASTPTVQAALPTVCLNRRMWIPLTRCCVDRDSGRGMEQRDFYPKDASFRRVPYLASYKYVVVEHPYSGLNKKPCPLGGESLRKSILGTIKRKGGHYGCDLRKGR